ncbi:MAG: hypothetical protein SF123_21095 [Chloroflexota bacterium]|nr:hypothetical protein [Chloroflexota bacterium]
MMVDFIVIDGTVTDNGELLVDLPADAPRGKVRVTIAPVTAAHPQPTKPTFLSPEEEQAWLETYDPELEALMNEMFNDPPLDLSGEDIANSPEIGAWEHRDDIVSGEDYVEKLRSKRRYTW